MQSYLYLWLCKYAKSDKEEERAVAVVTKLEEQTEEAIRAEAEREAAGAANGFATGRRAEELFKQYFPDEYYEALLES